MLRRLGVPLCGAVLTLQFASIASHPNPVHLAASEVGAAAQSTTASSPAEQGTHLPALATVSVDIDVAYAERQVGGTADPNVSVVLAVLAFARDQLGLPYQWGGNGPLQADAGFDCSGLTKAAYEAAGVSIPRTAHTQFYAGPHLPAGAALQPGDLVFYGTLARIHHVGLYIGQDLMINAPTFGEVVQIASYRWPGDDFAGATRPSGGPGGGLVRPPVWAIPAYGGRGSTPADHTSPAPATVATAPAGPASTPSPSSSPSPTSSPTPSPDVTPSPSPVPDVSPSPVPDVTPSPSPTPSPDVTPSPSPVPDVSPSPVADVTSSPTPSPAVTPTPDPTPSPTATPDPPTSPSAVKDPTAFTGALDALQGR